MGDSSRGFQTRHAVRRLTAGTAVAAVALTAVLFVDAGSDQAGALQDALVSLVTAVFPGGGLRSAPAPTPAPGATPVAVTGGS